VKRRKMAETKESLRARVQYLERTVEAQKARIEKLEGELVTLKETHAREGYNRVVRERRRRGEE
jgi:cell division protein FtsB